MLFGVKNREHINNYIMTQNTWKEKLQEVVLLLKKAIKSSQLLKKHRLFQKKLLLSEIEELLQSKICRDRGRRDIGVTQEERQRLQEDLREVEDKIVETRQRFCREISRKTSRKKYVRQTIKNFKVKRIRKTKTV